MRQLELARAVFLQRQRQAGDGAGHADGEAVVARFLRVGFALASRKVSLRGRGRRGLAVVDGDVALALGEMDHHEAAAADVAGARIGHRHGEADRDRGIDRVAAALEHLGADPRGALSCATTMPCLAVTGWTGGNCGARWAWAAAGAVAISRAATKARRLIVIMARA